MHLDSLLTIRDVALWRYGLPFASRPPRMASWPTMREGFVLALADDRGCVHHGEIAPLAAVHSETMADVRESLLRLLPQLKGAMVRLADFDPYAAGLALFLPQNQAVIPPSVRFGLDQALMGLVCRHGKSTRDARHAPLLTRWRQPSFACHSAALLSWDHSLPASLGDDGTVKIKVGLQPVADECTKLFALLDRLPERTKVRLDGNRAFALADLLRFWQLCEERGIAGRIDYFEEPLDRKEDYVHLLPAIPVALDESLWEMEPQFIPYCQAYILKPTRLGSIAVSLRWLEVARDHARRAVISSCYESGMTLLTYARLIHGAALAHIPMGLGSYAFLAGDLMHPALGIKPGHNRIEAPTHDLKLNSRYLVETLHGWEPRDDV